MKRGLAGLHRRGRLSNRSRKGAARLKRDVPEGVRLLVLD